MRLTNKKSVLGHIAAVVTISIWGVDFIASSVLLRSFTPFEILFFRFGLAMLALNIAYPKRMGVTTWRQELLLATAGLTGVTIYLISENSALLYTSVANVAVIVAISPVFTGLLSWWLLRDTRPAGSFFVGFLLAICGIGMVSFAGGQLELHPVGDFLAVVAALSWAFYSIILKKISALDCHIIQITRRIFLYGLMFLVPAIFVIDFNFGLERFLEAQNLISILFLGLGTTAAGFVLWNFALKQLGPVKTSVYIYLTPLVAVVASVLILNDTLTWLKVGGIVLVLFGLVTSNRKLRSKNCIHSNK